MACYRVYWILGLGGLVFRVWVGFGSGVCACEQLSGSHMSRNLVFWVDVPQALTYDIS